MDRGSHQIPSQLRDVFLALADPVDGGLWLVRRGGWLRFDPGIRLWEQGTIPGGVADAALDENAPAAGLFLRTAGGWYIAQRGGIALPSAAPGRPVRPQTVNQAIRDNPAISANSAALLFNNRLRNVRYTSAARAQGFARPGMVPRDRRRRAGLPAGWRWDPRAADVRPAERRGRRGVRRYRWSMGGHRAHRRRPIRA